MGHTLPLIHLSYSACWGSIRLLPSVRSSIFFTTSGCSYGWSGCCTGPAAGPVQSSPVSHTLLPSPSIRNLTNSIVSHPFIHFIHSLKKRIECYCTRNQTSRATTGLQQHSLVRYWIRKRHYWVPTAEAFLQQGEPSPPSLPARTSPHKTSCGCLSCHTVRRRT